MAIFKGAGVAIVTPMKENLEINYDKLDEILEEQIAGGTDAIIICGTTGESATMTEAEHMEAIRFTVERVKHRIPVIAGTGSNCTATAIELSKEAEKDGADGLLLVTPYYNKATQKGLIAHYTAVCSEVKLPAILQCAEPHRMQYPAGYTGPPCKERGQYRRCQGSLRQHRTGGGDHASLRREHRPLFRK